MLVKLVFLSNINFFFIPEPLRIIVRLSLTRQIFTQYFIFSVLNNNLAVMRQSTKQSRKFTTGVEPFCGCPCAQLVLTTRSFCNVSEQAITWLGPKVTMSPAKKFSLHFVFLLCFATKVVIYYVWTAFLSLAQNGTLHFLSFLFSH